MSQQIQPQWSAEHGRYFWQYFQDGKWVTVWKQPEQGRRSSPSHSRIDSHGTVDNSQFAAASADGEPNSIRGIGPSQSAPTSSGLVSEAVNVANSGEEADLQDNAKGRGFTIEGTWGKEPDAIHYETLDSSYYVRTSEFFVPGRMLSILYTEPAGSTTTDWDNENITIVKYGERAHTQIRRFVVVRARNEFCYGCPVFTYGKRATLKPGIRAYEHAIVYSMGQLPRLRTGETGIEKNPIPVRTPQEVSPLHQNSRINFGIHHPIQYNVKVKDLGKVAEDHIRRLIEYWQYEQNRDLFPNATTGGLAPSFSSQVYTPIYPAQGNIGHYTERATGYDQAASGYQVDRSSEYGQQGSTDYTTAGATTPGSQGGPNIQMASRYDQLGPSSYSLQGASSYAYHLQPGQYDARYSSQGNTGYSAHGYRNQ
ncbi:hypothetical protein K491DRAFT_649604 [Lophiostoma macrostomum CBS 122681]|uniref:DUF6590 domain-containing protein n=1 Tax=Lophiostoma macrostomum CBS 122681 TaxID=1314788 RepID=A0A6A6TM55_9PLEO|nr:hypothetical protein K491DRAFT_649604 [Lophiostoma macrostomum CBS 122681]